MAAMFNFNGKSFSGNNIRINNGRIYVDNQEVKNDLAGSGNDKKELVINLVINGNIDSLEVDNLEVDNCNTIDITGDVKSLANVNGTIKVNRVLGTLSSQNGNINCGGDIEGNVESKNGNISCQKVGGSVTTKNGNIRTNNN